MNFAATRLTQARFSAANLYATNFRLRIELQTQDTSTWYSVLTTLC
jgi:hypothetical protein